MRLLPPCALSLLLLLAFSSATRADVPLPDNLSNKPKPGKSDFNRVRADLPAWHLTIESRDDVREARLQVPRSMLERLSPEGGSAAGTAGLSFFGASPLHTGVAGLFLFVSLATAGILLARSRRQVAARVALVALACVGLAGALAAVALANIAPPDMGRGLNPNTLIKAVSSGNSISGQIRLEVVEGTSELRLIVPSKNRSRGDE